ncbi:PAS domain-containing sensor histidine kinase [Mesonia aestuariivivens]|uniref:histidine kinase n=1 Tax=Mesonia aestuariivivens TaxID=2796128 RepID=A0ABS6W4N8_9FLAO|nr:PAS domain-containing sensor histidine kinase [Mesonia aestuariivivens]MBW2962843.1 PAS domain S-box protein [Mesonia aestuariivivens]
MIAMPQNKNYKSLLEKTTLYAKMGSWELDLKSHELYWNRVTKLIHGVSENFECNINEALKFYKDAYSKNLMINSLKNAIEKNEEFDIKIKLTTALNEEIWVRSVGIPVIEDGVCTSVYGLFQDIDIEEKKKEKLHKQIQFISHVLENTSIGIASFDEFGHIEKVNSGLCEILGYRKYEMKKLTYKDVIFKEDINKFLIGLNKLKNNKIQSYTSKKRYRHKNGNILYVHLVLTVIRNINKEPINYLAQIIDLTPQYKNEEKLNSYLDITTDQNQRLLNFANIVSHNLKSHSGNLEMLLELLHEEQPQLLDNELMYLLGKSVENLSETIQHLNEVVLMHKANDKNIETLNLSHFIDKTIENVSASIKAENIQVDIQVNNELTVKAIPAYLESILLNLITNAIKYKDENKKALLKIVANKITNYIEINFVDNGLGIDIEKNKSKLFGMYNTFHSNENARGIGLFITKNQVEAIGGTIDLESKVGVGSTFKVKLLNGK